MAIRFLSPPTLAFLISSILMLDLAFVREHLSVVEEKLRSRNANPEEILGDFRQIESRRRAVTRELETALARRNELSKKIGPLMGAEKKGSITPEQKSELDALTAEVLKLKEGIPALEEQSKAADKELYDILATIPNLPHDSVPVGNDETRQRRGQALGHASPSSTSPPSRTGSSASSSASSTWNAPPKSPAPASLSTGISAPSSNAP